MAYFWESCHFFYHCSLKPNIFSHPSSSSFYWIITYISHPGDLQTFYNIQFSHIFIQDCGSYTVLTGITYTGVNLTWMSYTYDKMNLKVFCVEYSLSYSQHNLFFSREKFFLKVTCECLCLGDTASGWLSDRAYTMSQLSMFLSGIHRSGA